MSEEREIRSTFHWMEEFLDYFSGVRERTANTMKEYRYDLILFFRWLKLERGLVPRNTEWEDIDLGDIDEAFLRKIKLSELYRFVSWLAIERKNGPAARARRISALRSFFRYLHGKVKVLEQNPAAELELPKRMKSLPRYLDMDESLALLRAAAGSDEKSSARDYCILTLFLNCGMRLSELCGIDVTDIHENRLTVLGKGRKERTVYLNRVSMEALQQWLLERVPARRPDENALFVSRNRRRISQRAVENVVKKYIMAAGLDPARYSPHKLRHTAATLMYQHGQVDLRSLQQILGHESVATTEIYTHINDPMLQQAVEKNPLNEFRIKDLTSDEE